MARRTRAPFAPRDDAVERCKGFFGHAWDDIPTPPDAATPRRGYVTLHLRCSRCGTVKVYNVLRSDPGAAKPRYYHPEGYAVVKQSRADWKSQFIAGWKNGHH